MTQDNKERMTPQNQPLISFIIASYNAEKFIVECLDSCLNQTYKNIEVCITNDGSTDNSQAIIYEYSKDSRVKAHSFDSNKGKVAAFNHSMSMATGSYFALIGADDINYKSRIQDQLNLAHKEGLNLVWTNYDILQDGVISSNPSPKNQSPTKEQILNDNCMAGGSFLFDTKVRDLCFPMPENLKFEDWWISFNTIFNLKFGYLDKATFKYRIHSANTVGNNSNYLENKRKNILRHFAYHDKFSSILKVGFSKEYSKLNFANRGLKSLFIEDSFFKRVFIFSGSLKYFTTNNIRNYIKMLTLTLFGFKFLSRFK